MRLYQQSARFILPCRARGLDEPPLTAPLHFRTTPATFDSPLLPKLARALQDSDNQLIFSMLLFTFQGSNTVKRSSTRPQRFVKPPATHKSFIHSHQPSQCNTHVQRPSYCSRMPLTYTIPFSTSASSCCVECAGILCFGQRSAVSSSRKSSETSSMLDHTRAPAHHHLLHPPPPPPTLAILAISS